MRKFFFVFVLVILCFSFSSCINYVRGITPEQLEQILQEYEEGRAGAIGCAPKPSPEEKPAPSPPAPIPPPPKEEKPVPAPTSPPPALISKKDRKCIKVSSGENAAGVLGRGQEMGIFPKNWSTKDFREYCRRNKLFYAVFECVYKRGKCQRVKNSEGFLAGQEICFPDP